MQWKLEKALRSRDEVVKDAGLTLDFDEIARKGRMSPEEVGVAKWYGIYTSRTPGEHMARIVIPAGHSTSVEARHMARIAQKYGQGQIAFTTRQAAQLHYLQVSDLPVFLRDLHEAGMTTFHGCGDVARNVAACPWASVCPHRRLDVLPPAKETAELLSASRDLDNLPRKFKVTFSGCRAGCGQSHINCVGVVAVVRKRPDGTGETGYQVNIGGGLGWKPFIAQPVYSFVPAYQIAEVCRTIGILFRDQGERYRRRFSRLKFVVDRLGIARCREFLAEILDAEEVDRSRFETEAFDDCGPAIPDRPLTEPEPTGTDGFAIQRIMVPKGELSSEALERIASLAEIYGDKYVYSTNRQNLELHGVHPDRLAELQGEIKTLGFRTSGFFGLEDIVSCVGTSQCPLAITSTHDLFAILEKTVGQDKYVPIRDRAVINISGCPNTCGQSYIPDIGFLGVRVRELEGSTEGYFLYLGGAEDQFGEKLGMFKLADCGRVTEAILDTFLAADTHETLADHVRRVGLEPYAEAVNALGIEYLMAEKPFELSVFTGDAETAKDMRTLAKDVPCQAACPARTDVPAYIQHLAHGDADAAFLINQECNVLPQILGRVCTRPCQDQCRHQWTGVEGPVAICDLKRAATDGKTQRLEPLPAWYGASGKTVSIIGGGPSGLAAARELKRYGHDVTIYEREDHLGGQVRTCLPEFRLNREALEEDIEAIISTGIDVRMCDEVWMDRLVKLVDEYDATLLTTGASEPYVQKIPGLPESLRVDGLDFLHRYNDADPMPIAGDVLVIGGGFTAVDCARAARRATGPDANVTIMYRRGEAQMAATSEELRAVSHERIRIETLVTPVSAKAEGDRLESVTFRRNLLGPADETGKPEFLPIEGSEFDVPCGMLIFAIGHMPQPGLLPDGVEAIKNSRHTSLEGLFVAGDFSEGSGDVIYAVADGKAVADDIDFFLTGERRRKTYIHIEEAALTGRTRGHDLMAPPPMPVLPLGDRCGNNEVELGHGPADVQTHAWRCYLCNHKFEIDQDKCIYCDACIKVAPRDCIRRLSHIEHDASGVVTGYTEAPASEPGKVTYIWIDSDQCIRCGNCYNICPTDAISLRRLGRVTTNCDGA